MSREEMVEFFCALTCSNPEDHERWDTRPCEQVVEKVERLLAQEREKVRDLCVGVCESRESWRDWDSVPDLKYSTEAGTAAYYLGCEIRKLDLTKDLAASGAEESQPTAEEVKAVSAAIEKKAIGKLQLDEGGGGK